MGSRLGRQDELLHCWICVLSQFAVNVLRMCSSISGSCSSNCCCCCCCYRVWSVLWASLRWKRYLWLAEEYPPVLLSSWLLRRRIQLHRSAATLVNYCPRYCICQSAFHRHPFLVSTISPICGQANLRKSNKTGAARYWCLKLKRTRFYFCWYSASEPTGELTTLP